MARTGILALVPDSFVGPWSTRHHILTRLARRFPVVWQEPSIGWRDQWSSRSSTSAPVRVESLAPGLLIHAPNRLQPQLYRPGWLRRIVRRSRFGAGRGLLLDQDVDRVVLYVWRPEFADALTLVPHDFSCYHIDDEYTFSRTEVANSPAEIELIRRVDQVIVHSRRLMGRKGSINPHTAMVPNGVDYAAYSTRQVEPTDLAQIPAPRIGYVGVIKTQLDLDLMRRLARRLPHASFVFVGPIGYLGDKKESWDRLRALPNVHALGHRDVALLPAYTQHLDACLMCYEITDYTNAIFPLKLNEYLAAGRPVVSSRIDSVLAFSHVVGIADDDDAWVRLIEAALSDVARSEAAVQSRLAVAREYDWDRLVTRIAALFEAGTVVPTRRNDKKRA